MISQHFVQIDGLKLHYREVNRASGPGGSNGHGSTPLILMHASPRNSVMFEPLMAMFPATQHVIAIDTPGYGYSAPLPQPAKVIADYLPTLNKLFHQIAGPCFKLYGSATGAQLALGYADRYPGDVAHLMLDNAAHFDDRYRDAIIDRYFIDISPTADGSHLERLWQLSRQSLKYFPWFETNAEHEFRASEPTSTEIQSLVNEYLLCGPRYAEAYICAFKHERAEHYQSLTVPTTLFRWKGSLLLKQIDHLLTYPMPKCVKVVEVEPPMAARYAAIVSVAEARG